MKTGIRFEIRFLSRTTISLSFSLQISLFSANKTYLRRSYLESNRTEPMLKIAEIVWFYFYLIKFQKNSNFESCAARFPVLLIDLAFRLEPLVAVNRWLAPVDDWKSLGNSFLTCIFLEVYPVSLFSIKLESIELLLTLLNSLVEFLTFSSANQKLVNLWHFSCILSSAWFYGRS